MPAPRASRDDEPLKLDVLDLRASAQPFVTGLEGWGRWMGSLLRDRYLGEPMDAGTGRSQAMICSRVGSETIHCNPLKPHKLEVEDRRRKLDWTPEWCKTSISYIHALLMHPDYDREPSDTGPCGRGGSILLPELPMPMADVRMRPSRE